MVSEERSPGGRISVPFQLQELPSCLVWLILQFLDMRALARIAQTSHRFLKDSAAVSPLSVTISATLLEKNSIRETLLARLKHTRTLRLLNAVDAPARHRRRMCQFHPKADYAMTKYVTKCGSLLHAGAVELFGATSKLRSLDLTAMGHLSPTTLLLALKVCPDLQSMCCRACCLITKGIKEHISDQESEIRSRSLKVLDLSHTDTNDSDLISLLDLVPQLSELQLNFCDSLTDNVLRSVPATLSNLSVLGCSALSYNILQVMGRRMRIESEDTFVENSMQENKLKFPCTAMALTNMFAEYNLQAMI